MKKFRMVWAFLVTMCVAAAANAQEVAYSAYEKFDVRRDDFSVVGKAGSRIYTYVSTPDGHALYAYNDNMDKLATVMLDFFPSKIYETRFITYPDKILVLYQSVSGNKVIQHAALLDDMGRLIKGPIMLSETKTGLLGPIKDYYSSSISEDKKNIVVYSAAARGEKLDVEGKCIDDELNIVRRVRASYKAENALEHGELMVANSGTIYMPVYTPTGSKNFADQLLLLSMPPGEAKFEANEVPLTYSYASRVYLKIDNTNNRIYIGGFYSSKKSGNFEGVLYTYFDIGSATFMNRKNIAFDSQLLIATGDRSTKRAFNDFQIRQLIIKNDGGFVMVSEDHFVTNRSSYAPGFGYYSWYYPSMSQAVTEFHYNDILALSYNGEGVRDWYAFIRKDQYSQEDNGVFSSYAFLNSGGTLGFLFNDFDARASRIQLATIDGNGKTNMHSFTAEGNDSPDWLPRHGKQVSAREIVIPCFRKRQICFSKVVF